MTRIVFAAALLVSCASFAEIRGSGNVQRETRVVQPFTGVSVSSGIRGEVQIGKQQVEVEADDNVLPLIETVIEDGILVVRYKPHTTLTTQTATVVHVTAPAITALESSGGSGLRADLTAANELNIDSSGGGEVQAHQVSVKRLRANVSGGGALVLDGSAEQVKLAMSGGSRCKAEKLQARSVQIQATGGSTARLAASERLDGVASGGSVVQVRGNPETRLVTSGGSTVEKQ
jgi:hypothetical protein